MNQHLSMSAAIYARKSTDQSGVSDEQRSVARQVEHARSCAARKGWRVLDEHVYIDDGISGAEFERRPGLQRLRAALRPRPAFSVLIVSEQSRLSRDTADTLQLLKELARAGVRVFAYQEDRAISLETPSDTLVTTINAWKDAEGRREASVRTHDALARKARAAHVTGGRVFGYRNVDVFAGVDAHGRPQRSHVTREIREDEAAVVQRIFDLCAAGYGVKRIAAQLNETAAPCPRAQRQRLDGWAASSVRTVLFRTLYRGVVTWNRTKKRNAFGQVQQRPRDPRDWVQVDVAEWRIVSDALWQAAHDRLERARQNYLAGTQGKAWGRPVTGTAAKYLLTGIARCGVCGAGLTVRSRAHGAGRSFRYVCATHHYRGRAICANGLELRQPLADDAVLELLEADILRPSVVEQAIAMALDTLWSEPKTPDRRAAIAQQLTDTEGKLRQLAAAVEQGGQLSTLLGAIERREQERAKLRAELDGLATVLVPARKDRKALERALRARLTDWRGLLRSQVAEARQVLQTLLEERLVFTPARDKSGEACYELRATFAFGRMFSEILRSHGMASPAGFEPAFQP
jgi:site-specific DNA recombinase